jgi:hypothetical protein
LTAPAGTNIEALRFVKDEFSMVPTPALVVPVVKWVGLPLALASKNNTVKRISGRDVIP